MKKLLVFLVMLSLLSVGVCALDTSTTTSTVGTASVNWPVGSSLQLYADEILPKNGSVTHEARARVIFDTPITLGELDSISWRQYVTQGYPAHVDILLDVDGNLVFDSKKDLEYGFLGGGYDDVLVVEFAYNPMDHYARGPPYTIPDDYEEWYYVFNDVVLIDDTTEMWLYSACPGAPGSTDFMIDTLANWQTGKTRDYQCYPSDTGDGAIINSDTLVYGLEIEVDGWIAESEAYIRALQVNGELVDGFPSSSNDLDGTLDDIVTISVSPPTVSFGSIPRGSDITKAGDDIIVDTSGSDTALDEVYIYTDVTGDDEAFYEALLELAEDGTGTWNDVGTVVLTIPEGDSQVYNTQLQGNTITYESGSKTATITYTAYGEPLP